MNRSASWYLPRATTVGLALIVLILTGNMLVSEWNTKRLLDNEHRAAASQTVLTALEEVLAHEVEAEAAERAFLITDKTDYLERYHLAVDEVDDAMSRLAELTDDDTWQQERLAVLEQRVRSRMEDLQRVMAAKQTEGFDAARQTVLFSHASGLMNKIRELVDEMQKHEGQRLAERAAESRRSARMTTITDLIGSLLGIAMVFVAFRLFGRELAHRQEADDAVRRLAAIVESSDDAIVGETLDGIITSWNAGAARIYGYTADEAVGKPVAMLCPPESLHETVQQLERVRRGEPVEHFVTQRVRRDGERIDVSLSLSPIKDAAGEVIGASAIARDVTNTKAMQREILAIASEEQRRIGQDLHDGTGQELTGLAMLGQRLANTLRAKGLPEAASADQIVDRLEEALDHVRALSKGLVPVEVVAEGLMVALADLAARTETLQNVRCAFECPQPVQVADNQTATHLYRMSQEALANALKHGRPHSITLGLRASDDLLTLEVVDDGRGLAGTAEDGTGMGLRIMRYRAELIGAQLKIIANVPSGTRVVCELNRSPGAAPAASTDREVHSG